MPWCARDVLESTPKQLRNFFLCDLNAQRVEELQALVDSQPPPDKEKKEAKRFYRVLPGDFNEKVHQVLASGKITEREATFALLDQRTFECLWSTVVAISRHKPATKIELFYFLPVAWLHRALAANKQLDSIEQWWGSDDWRRLADTRVESIRAEAVRRFKSELAYKHVHAFPIFERHSGGGRVMYYMIHASDNDIAPGLMFRAYRNALAVMEPPEQIELALENLANG